MCQNWFSSSVSHVPAVHSPHGSTFNTHFKVALREKRVSNTSENHLWRLWLRPGWVLGRRRARPAHSVTAGRRGFVFSLLVCTNRVVQLWWLNQFNLLMRRMLRGEWVRRMSMPIQCWRWWEWSWKLIFHILTSSFTQIFIHFLSFKGKGKKFLKQHVDHHGAPNLSTATGASSPTP